MAPMTATEPDRTMIGRPIAELDTPALLLDEPAARRNMAKMSAFFRDKPCQLRPHFKNHKCAELARRQLDAGSAVGLTCAKLAEAQVLVERGFDNILVANQVVGPRKVQRLAELAGKATVRVAIDELAQAQAIARAAAVAGSTVELLIEVDIGMGRCGVQPGERLIELAGELVKLEGVRFWGLQAFEGHTPYINDLAERRRAATTAIGRALEARGLLEEAGIPIQGISGGASANYAITGLIAGITELQCGTYVTMDWRYHQVVPEFDVALSILATVISRPDPDTAVLDFGVKGAGGEFGPPVVKRHPEAVVPSFLSEEHLIVRPAPPWKVGDVAELIPSHACTTCNLYRQLYVHDGHSVVDVWPIEGSGCLT